MRRAKAFNSSCLQIVLVYLQPFRRNPLSKCASARHSQRLQKKQ